MMEIVIIVLMGLVLMILGISIYGLNRGYRKEIGAMRRPITDLLESGPNGSVLVIENPKTGCFTQFSKYVHNGGNQGISFDFPKAEWSKEYFELLQEYCKATDLKFELEVAKKQDELDFLTINLGTDKESAFELTHYVMEELFEPAPDGMYKVTLDHPLH